MRKQLTAAMVEKQAAPTTGRLEIFDTVVPALALRITANDARSFVVRGRVKGQASPIRITLGDATAIKLADAREQASDALRAMRAGADPRSPKAQASSELTFDALIDEWARLYLARSHSRRYREDSPATIRRGFRGLLSKSAGSITKADAVNALDKIAHKPGEQDKARRCASACYGWAYKRGKVPSNPFAGLPDMPASVARDRVLSDAELLTVWAAAGALGYPWEAFYKLAILTLQRRETVAGISWSEIDFDKRLWRIPGSRMKMGKPHDVHLSEPALDVLRSPPRIEHCDFVLSTTGRTPISGFSKAKRQIDAAITRAIGEALAHWQPHDFRRTGVSTLAQLGFDSIIADKLLAHQPGKLRGVAAIYQRYDFARERAHALDAWAAHVTRAAIENVVQLPARAAQ